MRLSTKSVVACLAFAGSALAATSAFAQASMERVGAPVPKGTALQQSGGEVARVTEQLDTMILYIITAIVIFVTGLLIYVIIRFNERTNKTPAKFTHNSPLEIAWTIVPIVILVFIGSFSLPVLFKQVEIPAADVVIKVTGNQWYWSYEYPGQEVAFDSFMIGSDKVMNPEVEAELVAAGYTKEEFLLATDTAVVVPVGKNVLLQITAADVLHAWYVPALGVQMSAVPGRLNQSWFVSDKEGIYFGQCTTLCGKDHAYMPIVVKVVSEAVYAEWLESAKAGDVQLSSVLRAEETVRLASN